MEGGAVTKDLASFWERQYPAIRKELMRSTGATRAEDPTVPTPRMRPRKR